MTDLPHHNLDRHQFRPFDGTEPDVDPVTGDERETSMNEYPIGYTTSTVSTTNWLSVVWRGEGEHGDPAGVREPRRPYPPGPRHDAVAIEAIR